MQSRLAGVGSLGVAVWLAALLLVGRQPAPSSPRLTALSGPSPFAACAVSGPGVNYLDAEVEPLLAVNPIPRGAARANLVAVWQQDRWSTTAARGVVAAYSFDGGQSWSRTPLPFSACAPGGLPYQRATDPWIAFGPDGIAYASAVALSPHGPDFFPVDSAIVAATSTDGGRTWANLRVIAADDATSQLFNDKATLTADPTRPGVAYVVWQRLDATNPSFFTVPSWLSRTTDGGQTWSPPRALLATGPNDEAFGNQIVVDPRTGTLYNVFNWIIRTAPHTGERPGHHVAFQLSADGGQSWTAPRVIAPLHSVGVTDPGSGAFVRTAQRIPSAAIDPASGRLYVVWQDAHFGDGHHDEIAIASSADGGATWSQPLRVNAPTGRAAFTPSIAVDRAGVVGVSYYALRGDAEAAPALPADYWLALSADGAARFRDPRHVAGPFDLRAAPNAEGHFLGEYQGLASGGGRFFLAFARPGADDPADVVFTAVAHEPLQD